MRNEGPHQVVNIVSHQQVRISRGRKHDHFTLDELHFFIIAHLFVELPASGRLFPQPRIERLRDIRKKR